MLKEYSPSIRKIVKPPFGYEFTDNHNLIPIEEDLDNLSRIKDMIDNKAISLRDGAFWLSSKSTRNITYEGLRLRLKRGVRLEGDEEE